MKRITLTALVALLVISCSNHANQFLLEEYEGRKLDSSISLLTMELDQLYEQFPDHNFGALRPPARSVFDNRLVSLLSQQTSTNIQGKFNDQVLLEYPFRPMEFELKSGMIEILSPESGTVLKSDEINSRFVLILDQFRFTRYEIEVGGGTYAGQESRPERRIRFETGYLIWDNEKGEAIAWGMAESNRILNFDKLRSTYSMLISDVFSKIIDVSPFRPAQSG